MAMAKQTIASTSSNQRKESRSQFFLHVASGPFFGFNRPGAKVSQGLINSWWMQGMMAGHKNAYDCIKAFSETDFTGGVDALSGTISEPAWKTKPSWYLVATDDKMIPPAAQRFMSKRAGSTVVEVAGSHAIYVSQPNAVAVLIEKAAKPAKRNNGHQRRRG
jgi:pimeloyl-ACP methyl ester carboxylesterase